MSVLRDRLLLTITASRLSQAEVARVARLNVCHLNDICRGRSTHVTADTVVKLARAFGCSADWLLGLTSLGPSPIAVRQSIAHAGGRVLETPDAEWRDPINVNAGASRRGRVRARPAPSRLREADEG